MVIVTVDRDRCIGSENCTIYAPTTFRTDDEGIAEVLSSSTDDKEAVSRAVHACPVQALSLAAGVSA